MEWAIARPPQWNIANHPAMRTIERYLIFLQSSMVVCENLFVAGTARARQRAREIQEFMFARAQPDPEHDNRFHVKIAMSPNKDEDTLFLEGLTELVLDLRLKLSQDAEKPMEQDGRPKPMEVSRIATPQMLRKVFNTHIEHGTADKMSVEQVLVLCEKVIKYSVKTGSPNFHNQMFGGIDTYAMGGSWLGDALNTSMYTFEMAPVFNVMEEAVIDWMLELVGWKAPDGPRKGEGIFTAGGSMANMYAMACARHKMMPDFKRTGYSGAKPLVVFTSDQSHYSIKKNANWLGIGTENVCVIGSDERGAMLPRQLKEEIENMIAGGMKRPLMVVATFGTTVLGAIDPIDEIARICELHKIWLHVDACWGGSLLVSPKFNNMTACLSKADSISWNPHKMLGAPLQTSVILIKEQYNSQEHKITQDLLRCCNEASAPYLFQTDKHYDTSLDTGDSSVQCGRRPDSFNLWLMLKARGVAYFAEAIDHAIDMIKFFHQKLVEILSDNVELLILDFDHTKNINVCFFVYPQRHIPRSAQKTEYEFKEFMNKIPPRAKKEMARRGKVMITYQALPEKHISNCFRMVITALPRATEDSIDNVIHELWDIIKDYRMEDFRE